MFSGDHLVGYWDMMEEKTSHVPKSTQNDATLILNRINFNSNLKCYNCVLQQNSSGLIEIVSVRNIAQNEQIICWFAESYYKNIKSKLSYLLLRNLIVIEKKTQWSYLKMAIPAENVHILCQNCAV